MADAVSTVSQLQQQSNCAPKSRYYISVQTPVQNAGSIDQPSVNSCEYCLRASKQRQRHSDYPCPLHYMQVEDSFTKQLEKTNSEPPIKPAPPQHNFTIDFAKKKSKFSKYFRSFESGANIISGPDSPTVRQAWLSTAASAARSLIDRVKSVDGFVPPPFRNNGTAETQLLSPSTILNTFNFSHGPHLSEARHSLISIPHAQGDLPPHTAVDQSVKLVKKELHITQPWPRRHSAPPEALLNSPTQPPSLLASHISNGQPSSTTSSVTNGSQPTAVSKSNEKFNATLSLSTSSTSSSSVPTVGDTAKSQYLPPPVSQVKSATKSVGQDERLKLSEAIPRFYFPVGKPVSNEIIRVQTEKLNVAFEKLGNTATRQQIGEIAKDCLGFGRYWRIPLFQKAALMAGLSADKLEVITKDAFVTMWKKMVSHCYDNASRFIWLLQSSQTQPKPTVSNRQQPLFSLPQDFIPLMQDIVDNHPSLDFLRDAKEFHSRYIHTVIARIFYAINRSWSGRVAVAELRNSKFLDALQRLDDEDVNRSMEFFSYEHFYVIYCKFWELDKDHDLLITRDELSTHNNHAISPRIIERIFSGAVTKGKCLKEGKMSYNEFVWFLISEEDKKHPTSIEYWFRCMDLDGDGYLTAFEMEYFYQEQHTRLMQMSIEPLALSDLICQLLDMVNPKIPGKITLGDLKNCRLSDVFFNTFINIYKYIDYEQKDPFSIVRDGDMEGPVTDWERFAAQEYMALVAEETSNDGGGGAGQSNNGTAAGGTL